jgi:hypothetical protein
LFDWLNQRRIVVLGFADARAHRPARYVFGRIGLRHRLELFRLRGVLAEPGSGAYYPQLPSIFG